MRVSPSPTRQRRRDLQRHRAAPAPRVELRFLAQRRPPDRWVIDLGSQAPMLLKPEQYYAIANVEDRLFVPADHVPLFERAGWQKQV
jgi:hypothetical protein